MEAPRKKRKTHEEYDQTDDLFNTTPKDASRLLNTTVSPRTPNSPSQRAARLLVSRSRRLLALSPIKKSPKKKPKKTEHLPWTDRDDKYLVEFITLHQEYVSQSCSWPATKTMSYWEKAAGYLQEKCGTPKSRSALSVRSRVVNSLRLRFPDFDSAEDHFHIDHEDGGDEITDIDNFKETKAQISKLSVGNQKKIIIDMIQKMKDDRKFELVKHLVLQLPKSHQHGIVSEIYYCADDRKEALDNLFSMVAAKDYGLQENLSLFTADCLHAMKRLHDQGRPNSVYRFAYALCRKVNERPILSLDMMPFGMLEYVIGFYWCTNIMQIREPNDYRLWIETMENEFGGRFIKLFRGPMWSGCSVTEMKNPEKARANVPCSGIKWNLKRQKQDAFSSDELILESALSELKQANPDGRFWIKLDATDVKGGVFESVKGEWSGDCDLGDGMLRNMRNKYDNRCDSLALAMQNNQKLAPEKLHKEVELMIEELENDAVYLETGLAEARKKYKEKFAVKSTAAATLKDLNWNIVEFQKLHEESQSFLSSFRKIKDMDIQECKRALRRLQKDYKTYLTNVFKKKREPPASHVMVVMVSDERRHKKPYALPVKCVPYNSISDQFVRDITKDVRVKMLEMGLTHVGTSTDGEFIQLRTQGEGRPIHIWQLIHNAKQKAQKMSKNTLLDKFLQIRVDADGRPETKDSDACIPREMVSEINRLQTEQGWHIEEAISKVRQELVPRNATPQPFRRDVPETFLDQLRTLAATMYFRSSVSYWKGRGVDFTTYLCIPDEDSVSGRDREDRGDHNHILKRIAKHTREGKDKHLDYATFDSAMRDKSTGLTQIALVGKRKQSVGDAERLLSFHVSKFMEENGHHNEAKYVQTIAEWHEANDGRGLTQLERCRKNYGMLNYLLDELMPWHTENYDFSTIDINRPWNDVRGLSRESLIEITTNIESTERRRRLNNKVGYAEHPRASSTDDVEAFFSVVHHHLGQQFTLKEFRFKWKKLVREFCKRMDKNLPFYYWTLNERFSEDSLPSFDEKPQQDDQSMEEKKSRLHLLKINRREDASIFTPGRSFLPVRNKQSIRQRLHKPVSELPSVPEELEESFL